MEIVTCMDCKYLSNCPEVDFVKGKGCEGFAIRRPRLKLQVMPHFSLLREVGCNGFTYEGNGDIYDRFQWEAIANIRPGGYANMDEAREAYKIFCIQIEQMAKLAYNAFRREELHLEGKGTSGIVPEERIIHFLVEKWEMDEAKAKTLLAVMLHPKNRITERQGGGVVV